MSLSLRAFIFLQTLIPSHPSRFFTASSWNLDFLLQRFWLFNPWSDEQGDSNTTTHLPAPPKWDLLPWLSEALDELSPEPLPSPHGAFGIRMMMMMVLAECQDVIFHHGVIFGVSSARLGVGLADPCGSLPSLDIP